MSILHIILGLVITWWLLSFVFSFKWKRTVLAKDPRYDK